MPTYEYICQRCARPFEVQASIAEYSKGLKPKCPNCGSTKTLRAFRSVNVLTTSRAGGPSNPGCGPGCACG